MTDGQVESSQHSSFQTVGEFAAPVGGAGNDVRVEDDDHRRWARTSQMACSTAASSSGVSLDCVRLRSSNSAHCSAVKGWCLRITMVPL